MIPLNQLVFFFFRVSILHPVRASEAVDPASKLIKILLLTRGFDLYSAEG